MLIVMYDHPTFELSTKKYSETNKVGTMANLPTMRINKYYRYIGHYNNFLQAKIARTGELSKADRYKEFNDSFNKLKQEY